MNKGTPWDDIKTPENDFNIRQVKGTKELPLCWGKDNTGHCVFVVELQGNHQEIYRKNVVSVHGIKTDLRLLSTTKNQGFVITLEKHIDQDLFSSLCDTLIEALIDIPDSAVRLSVALAQIKRWKRFMAGRRIKMLTDEEIRGLFGELVFIENMLHHGFSENDVLEAWQGPEDSHQDFIFLNTGVEIKVLSGRERNTVRISSEDQLERASHNLFLRILRLVNMPESEKSISLNGLIKRIQDSFEDADVIESFSEKLAKVGYVELLAYDTPEFLIVDEKTYHVTDAFPRLIRSELPAGITRVGYEIALEKIKPFVCDHQNIWGK